MLSQAASNAARDAVLALVEAVQISDANGVLLVEVLRAPGKYKAIASGEAKKWRLAGKNDSFILSGKVGEGLTLDRTDIQRGGTVSINSLNLAVK